MRRGFLATLLAAMLVASFGASHAEAAGGYWIDTKVQCVNKGGSVGVWVNAANGGSGWAEKSTRVSDGWGWTHIRKYLPKGGKYRLNVGCGGSPQKWGMTAYSGSLSGSNPGRIICNDVPKWLKLAWKIVPGFGRLDLTRDITYGTCKAKK